MIKVILLARYWLSDLRIGSICLFLGYKPSRITTWLVIFDYSASRSWDTLDRSEILQILIGQTSCVQHSIYSMTILFGSDLSDAWKPRPGVHSPSVTCQFSKKKYLHILQIHTYSSLAEMRQHARKYESKKMHCLFHLVIDTSWNIQWFTVGDTLCIVITKVKVLPHISEFSRIFCFAARDSLCKTC